MVRRNTQQRVDETNEFLREDLGIRIKLDLEGYRLRIRVTLPPDASRGHRNRQQYTVSLFLDASVAGIEQAKQDVIHLNWLLVRREFTWDTWRQYLKQTSKLRRIIQETAKKSVERFEQHILANPPKPKRKGGRKRAPQIVWKKDFAPYLNEKRLRPWDEPLSEETVEQAIKDTREYSSSRETICTRLKQLVEFLNLKMNVDFKGLGKGYDMPPLKEGELPRDQEILNVHHSIPDLLWKNAHGAQATFGLRNSEIPLVDLSKIEKAVISGITTYILPVPDDSKTGFRIAAALCLEWVEELGLINAELPKIETEGKTLQWIGEQLAKSHKRMKVPYNPYMLRHAWAIRAIFLGIPTPIASLAMGHSEAVHCKQYWRFLDKELTTQAFAAALAKSNRPGSSQQPDT